MSEKSDKKDPKEVEKKVVSIRLNPQAAFIMGALVGRGIIKQEDVTEVKVEDITGEVKKVIGEEGISMILSQEKLPQSSAFTIFAVEGDK